MRDDIPGKKKNVLSKDNTITQDIPSGSGHF
jgi:hypothetical protein